MSPSPKKRSTPEEPRLFKLFKLSPEDKDPKSPDAVKVKPLED
jgi:hypothetical protein